MTVAAVYHHANGVTHDFHAHIGSVEMPGKQVYHKRNKVGISSDPNRPFRKFTLTANQLTGAQLNTLLVTRLMPAAAPTYKAQDYPKLVIDLDGGTTTWTIKGMITAISYVPAGTRYTVTATFEESSHS